MKEFDIHLTNGSVNRVYADKIIFDSGNVCRKYKGVTVPVAELKKVKRVAQVKGKRASA